MIKSPINNMNPETEYTAVVFVKETGGENGPGHVSAALVEKSEVGTKITHTSLVPDPVGCLVNATSLGSIPVIASNCALQEDVTEADHVLARSITEEEYRRGLETQQKLAADMQTGNCLYSVWGEMNPVAPALAYLVAGYRTAQSAAEDFRNSHACPPAEDLCGLMVLPVDQEVRSQNVVVKNCVTAVGDVLASIGFFNQTNIIIPSNMTEATQQAGFEKISKDDFTQLADMQFK